MKILCIASKKDDAALNIAEYTQDDIPIKYIEGESILINQHVPFDLVIYLSRHKSKSKKPTLTAHPIGNYGNAKYGGKDHTLMLTNSEALKKVIQAIDKNARSQNLDHKYEVTLEVSHHGPEINVPAIFVEVGSTEKEWNDLSACKCIAKSVGTLKNLGQTEVTSGIYFGRGHYSRKATRLMLETEIAVGHMCPKYARKWLNSRLIQEMINKTLPKPQLAIIDKNGFPRKKEIVEILRHNNLDIKYV